MDSKNCSICDETMTSKRRTEICCVRCNKSCCNKCFTTYLMIEPTCMFCKDIIPDDFISKNTTKTFFNNYSKHKRLQMFKREESLVHLAGIYHMSLTNQISQQQCNFVKTI